jgi:hypothetical protein
MSARFHALTVWDPIDLVHSLDHSFEIRHLKKLGHLMCDCVAAALLSRTWLARRDAPKGGEGGDVSSLWECWEK